MKSHAPRTDHAESAERARAFLRFIQARRDMLQAMHEWIALHPTAGHAQDEADSTVSAVRQIGADKGMAGMDRIARNSVSLLDKGSIQAQNGNRPGAGNTEATVSEPTGRGATRRRGELASPLYSKSILPVKPEVCL